MITFILVGVATLAVYIFGVGAMHEWLLRRTLRIEKITRAAWNADRELTHSRKYDFEDAVTHLGGALFWPVTLVIVLLTPVWRAFFLVFRAGEGTIAAKAESQAPPIPKATAKEKS